MKKRPRREFTIPFVSLLETFLRSIMIWFHTYYTLLPYSALDISSRCKDSIEIFNQLFYPFLLSSWLIDVSNRIDGDKTILLEFRNRPKKTEISSRGLKSGEYDGRERVCGQVLRSFFCQKLSDDCCCSMWWRYWWKIGVFIKWGYLTSSNWFTKTIQNVLI